MRRPPSATMHAEPNVTPFLDVLLVLLIIFMYVCLNQQKVVMADLPDPHPSPGNEVPIVLEVRGHETYAINTRLVARDALDATIRAIYAGRPTKTMIVRASGDSIRYQDVVTAIDVAKGAGVVAIGLR